MLSALIHGHAGTIAQDLPPGASWSRVFKAHEDLLTATVFERIGYLPDGLPWALLRSTFPDLPEHGAIALQQIVFWPRWHDVVRGHGRVEPDVILEFWAPKLGDVIMCVEAKPPGGAQFPKQWEREIKALLCEYDAAELHFCALGGLGQQPQDMARQLHAQIDVDPKVKVHGARWRDLAAASVALQDDGCDPAISRVLRDINDALGLYGVRHVNLGRVPRKHDWSPLDQTLSTLRTFR